MDEPVYGHAVRELSVLGSDLWRQDGSRDTLGACLLGYSACLGHKLVVFGHRFLQGLDPASSCLIVLAGDIQLFLQTITGLQCVFQLTAYTLRVVKRFLTQCLALCPFASVLGPELDNAIVEFPKVRGVMVIQLGNLTLLLGNLARAPAAGRSTS